LARENAANDDYFLEFHQIAIDYNIDVRQITNSSSLHIKLNSCLICHLLIDSVIYTHAMLSVF
jgi:hypothetical protein